MWLKDNIRRLGMAWTEAARAKYRRGGERYESDLTDAEWVRQANWWNVAG